DIYLLSRKNCCPGLMLFVTTKFVPKINGTEEFVFHGLVSEIDELASSRKPGAFVGHDTTTLLASSLILMAGGARFAIHASVWFAGFFPQPTMTRPSGVMAAQEHSFQPLKLRP